MSTRRGALRRLSFEASRELVSAARCATHYPLGLVEAAFSTGRPCGDPTHDTPVLLVHGYGHNRSGWFVLDRRLRRAGFTSVHTLNYVPVGRGVPSLGQRLEGRVSNILRATGAARVHLVGHSLGGIIIRWFVQELGGAEVADTAITLGSPHQGSPAAMLPLPERTARDLRPGSSVLRRLDDGAGQPAVRAVRWIAYSSRVDVLVPGPFGRLHIPGAVNIDVPGAGHLGLLLSRQVASSVTHQLEAAEGVHASITGLAPAADPAAPLEPAVLGERLTLS